MEDKFYETKFLIRKASIPIMLKAFSCGTRFKIKTEEWNSSIVNEDIKFHTRYYRDAFTGIIYFRVSNDERRRLLPILKRLHSEFSTNIVIKL